MESKKNYALYPVLILQVLIYVLVAYACCNLYGDICEFFNEVIDTFTKVGKLNLNRA